MIGKIKKKCPERYKNRADRGYSENVFLFWNLIDRFYLIAVQTLKCYNNSVEHGAGTQTGEDEYAGNTGAEKLFF